MPEEGRVVGDRPDLVGVAVIEGVEPRAFVADERDAQLVAEAGFDGPVLTVPDERLYEAEAAPVAELDGEDIVLLGEVIA